MAATGTREERHRRIRRYGNRKLYDTEGRRYVTLEEIATLVADGHDVSVVDQRTGEDITNPTLVQVLLAAVKGGKNRIPGQVLTRLIRLAAGPDSGWASWPEPHEAAGRARQEAERIVTALIGRGRLTLDEAVSLRQDLGQMVHRLVAEAQSGVESRLRALVERGEDVAGRSLSALRGRFPVLDGYIDRPARATAARRGGRTAAGRAGKKR
jgi:polyhydroxyalkanoate synthesis repressor PhaR